MPYDPSGSLSGEEAATIRRFLKSSAEREMERACTQPTGTSVPLAPDWTSKFTVPYIRQIPLKGSSSERKNPIMRCLIGIVSVNIMRMRDGYFVPSQQEIAQECGVSISTVRRAQRHLRELGHLEYVRGRWVYPRTRKVCAYGELQQSGRCALSRPAARSPLTRCGSCSAPHGRRGRQHG
ncbi:helix-turn-helix domain-containing protein [Streptomyces sp. NPDC054863]